MAGLLSFDILPALSEGDERISLADILAIRDACLSEVELWALCKECCVAIQSVHNSCDMFQALCITPDTLAFDSAGAVCFLDLGSDPLPMYVPPEYRSVGNSFKAHLYSLGMTMLFGAEYNVSQTDGMQRRLGDDLQLVINSMTIDEYEQRISLEEVLTICELNLDGHFPETICKQMASIAKFDTVSIDDDRRSMLSQMSQLSQNSEGTGTPMSTLLSAAIYGPHPDADSDLGGDLEFPNEGSPDITPTITPPIQATIDLPPEPCTIMPPVGYRETDIEETALISDTSPPKPKVARTVILYHENMTIGSQNDEQSVTIETTTSASSLPSGLVESDRSFEVIQGERSENVGISTEAEENPSEDTMEPKQVVSTQTLILSENIENNERKVVSKARLELRTSPRHVAPGQFTAVGAVITDSQQVVGGGAGEVDCRPGGDGPQTQGNTLHLPIGALNSDPSVDVGCGPRRDVNGVGASSGLLRLRGRGASLSSEPPSPPHAVGAAGVTEEPPSSSSDPGGESVAETSVATLDETWSTGTSDFEAPANLAPSTPVTVTYDSVFGKFNTATGNTYTYSTDEIDIGPHLPAKEGMAGGSNRDKLKSPHTPSPKHSTPISSLPDGSLPAKTLKHALAQAARDSINTEKEVDMLTIMDSSDLSLQQQAGNKTSRPSSNGSDKSIKEGQSVQSVLDKLCCGLHENELWALCRECVLALQRDRHELPAYISLETVVIEESGRVIFRPVPEGDLEVVYLAPEIQQHGVVTEKTCLFGIAAMLWLAADYKLPANQEPALSDVLENMLISMTQDDTTHRPAATEVLQSCTEHQRKQDLTSTEVCASLFADALKAEEFGKDNRLVKDLLDQQLQEQAETQKAQIFDKIKGLELKSSLKPVSERQLKQKPKIRTLHDQLVEEIRNPSKKLRKSSKPRIFPVKDIFLNDPELMEGLRHVIGKDQSLPNSNAIQQQNGVNLKNSAFNPVTSKGIIPYNKSRQLPSQAPQAFNSTATHFSPIVVSSKSSSEGSATAANNKKDSRSQQSGAISESEKDKQVAKKVRELKRNLFKNRAPISLAQDIEKEVAEEHSKNSTPDPNMAYQGNNTPPANQNPAMQNMSNMQMMQGSSPNMTQTAFANGMQGQGQMPGFQGHGQVAQGQFQNMMPMQQFGFPMPAMQPGMFPFQVQLQQDPQTGMFNIVPMMNMQGMVPNMVPNNQQQSQMFTNNANSQQNTASGSEDAQSTQPSAGEYVTYQDLLNAMKLKDKVDSDGDKSDSKAERRRYMKHHSKDKAKEQKLRARSESTAADKDNQNESLKKSSSSTKNGEKKSSLSSSTESKRSRSSKDGTRRGRSRTLGSLELKDDLEKALLLSGEGDIKHEKMRIKVSRSASGSRLKKSNSEEFLDKSVDREQAMTSSRPSGHESRTRLKRAKSGSAIDYKHLMEFKVFNDINIDEPQQVSRTKSSKSSQPRNDQKENKSGKDIDDRARSRSRSKQKYQYNAMSPVRSPISPPDSPSSPILSKDSGVSGLNVKTGDVSLMERLLNSDTIRHQERLSRVIRLLQDEFAYEGYMENGIEDLAMAEYVLSLTNLKWDTFNSAITEKYCDLFWQEELLVSLFEAVNGHKPHIEKRSSKTEGHRNGQSNGHASNGDSGHMTWSGSDSAFRPIIHDGKKPLGGDGPVYKPRAIKNSFTDTSDSTDNEAKERRRRYRKKHELDRTKSSSMHDLLHEKHDLQPGEYLVKSHSQDELMESARSRLTNQNSPQSAPKPIQQPRQGGEAPKTKLIYVKSSGSENDNNFESNNMPIQRNPIAYPQPQVKQIQPRPPQPAYKSPPEYQKSTNSYYIYRYDSDSSSCSEQRHIPGHQHNRFARQNALQRVVPRQLSRDESVSSHGSNHSGHDQAVHSRSEGYINTLGSTTDSYESDTPKERIYSRPTENSAEKMFRGSVVYYSAEIEGRLRSEVRDFAKQVDTRTRDSIEAKMAELDQQMMMEHRMKKRTMKFYQKLMEASKTNKATAEQRNMMTKMGKQLVEMNTKLDFLDSAKKHLEMLYAEQWGLDLDLLYALARCPGDQPMLLSMTDNPLLQYQTIPRPEGATHGVMLQAGTPEGLMSYAFAQYALSDGYIHQFFYCYRYFATPGDLFNFIHDKFSAATLSLSPEAEVPVKVKARGLDLLQVWIEGYYSIDFKHDPDLTKSLYNFIKERVIKVDAQAEHLLELMEDCQDGRRIDLHYPQFCVSEDSETQLNQLETTPKKWESFKAALHLSAKPVKLKSQQPPLKNKANSTEKRNGNPSDSDTDTYQPLSGIGRRTDNFSLADYTPQTLAEQLTLIEQELFRHSHPVHYLNSKAQGVGVALANNQVLNKGQSMYRLNSAWEDSASADSSLFVGTFAVDDIIQRLIEHSQAVSFWVAAEILSSTSTKVQVAVLNKFIYIAKICHELRNYATCMAILDGLENIIVRQVPAWKSLPSKCMALMEELASVRVFLKTDSMCLLDADKDGHLLPTIPCVLLFLLHVQQMEIGGFRLANGMFKWQKIKNIGKVIDQIRVFRERRYTLAADTDLQSIIQQRIRDFGQQDLHTIASQQDTNYQKMAAKKLGSAFKRMRGKWGSKSET